MIIICVLNVGIISFAEVVGYVEKRAKSVGTMFNKGQLPLFAVCLALILAFATLVQVFLHDGFHADETMISQIVFRLAEWEDKTVKVEGTVEKIPRGIMQPFNYWLSERGNQANRIGLRWLSDGYLSGNVIVIGTIKKGYAWVHPDHPGWWTYYIEATLIFRK